VGSEPEDAQRSQLADHFRHGREHTAAPVEVELLKPG
jgi:hypothetical protein